ncbi:intein C-terminal splicing region/intein N-terminal splicing region [Abditibacterium utsteinense]|uniref:Intein C-terminal splicing region/intein N-terminal splicing region n=1 Tax=Abditibacterium utsteinense TaxID=1960156 RepID=A0A2S8SQL6_9BACT|nr:Hint domain-containing protein [Abditibacterium utsteinense]PQV63075.1 intein C-terminal splicing region/intein N-terminal splicing region [Abditibacterium utsteinense]
MNSFNQFNGGLAAGTLVTTPDGDMRIEDVKAGDLVLSGVGGCRTRSYEVNKVSANHYCGPMLKIVVNCSDYQFRATPNHICFSSPSSLSLTDNAVFLYAFDGESELDEENSLSHFICIANSNKDAVDFSNLDQADKFARQMAKANGGLEIKRFADFNQYYEPFNFMPATDLKVAMQVPVTKNETVESATITRIDQEQYDGLVYDLDIPEARNFAANGVLVHDSTRVLRCP